MAKTMDDDSFQAVLDADEYPSYRLLLAKALTDEYPDCGPALILYASALVELARYNEACSALTQAIEHYAADKLTYPFREMGHLYQAKGEHAEAVKWFDKAIHESPDDAVPHMYLGSVLAVQGKLAEAEECHRKALQLSQGPIDEAYLNLGLVLRAQYRYEEAKECFEKALELDPEYEMARLGLEDMNKVIAHLARKDEDKAM